MRETRTRHLAVAVVFALVVAACGSTTSGVDKAEEAPATTTAPAASAGNVETTASTVSTTTSTTASTAENPAMLSFAKDIQPMIETNCSSCHQSGGIGSHHAAMSTAGDVAKIASSLLKVTEGGYMPPWPASDKSVPFKDVRRLSVEQLDLLEAWVAGGSTLDVPAATPLLPVAPSASQNVRADLTVKMPTPYPGDRTRFDEYQCFILEPAIPQRGFMTGYAFLPDDFGSVHHVILRKEPASNRAAIEEADAKTAAPGWSCPAGMDVRGGDGTAGIGGWVPGQAPRRYPEGLGQEFNEGDFIVAQMHYNHAPQNYNGIASKGTDQSSMIMEFAEDPSKITPIRGRTLLGPMEMPCPAGETAPLCDRELAQKDVIERWGTFGGLIPGGLAAACGTTVEALAAQSDGLTAKTTCDHKMNSDMTVFGLLGHMHEFGSSFKMTLNPGTPDERVLLDIPDWNFGWQLTYEPVEHIEIASGDTVRIECGWERARQPKAAMRYVMWAEGTEDEMCYSSLTFYRKP